jgi:hypothetical protein
MGGVFLGGADCADAPCGPGACCFQTSCNIADAFSCIAAGREFAGAGTSCLDDPCGAGVGACCFGDGACQDLAPADCASAGGTWLSAHELRRGPLRPGCLLPSVGITDLLLLLPRWGPASGNPADLDGDGIVGITDLLALLGAWGPCS